MINRNRNHKLGKVILFTFYDDGPLVVQDDFTTEVQTDTRSLGSGLRGEERFEYLGFDVVLDADAVIADTQRAAILIRRKEDLEVVTIESRSAVRQGFIVKLIDRVARVGDQLAQNNLLMGINRVDHEIKKSFRLRFKLFFCHANSTSFSFWASKSRIHPPTFSF